MEKNLSLKLYKSNVDCETVKDETAKHLDHKTTSLIIKEKSGVDKNLIDNNKELVVEIPKVSDNDCQDIDKNEIKIGDANVLHNTATDDDNPNSSGAQILKNKKLPMPKKINVKNEKKKIFLLPRFAPIPLLPYHKTYIACPLLMCQKEMHSTDFMHHYLLHHDTIGTTVRTVFAEEKCLFEIKPDKLPSCSIFNIGFIVYCGANGERSKNRYNCLPSDYYRYQELMPIVVVGCKRDTIFPEDQSRWIDAVEEKQEYVFWLSTVDAKRCGTCMIAVTDKYQTISRGNLVNVRQMNHLKLPNDLIYEKSNLLCVGLREMKTFTYDGETSSVFLEVVIQSNKKKSTNKNNVKTIKNSKKTTKIDLSDRSTRSLRSVRSDGTDCSNKINKNYKSDDTDSSDKASVSYGINRTDSSEKTDSSDRTDITDRTDKTDRSASKSGSRTNRIDTTDVIDTVNRRTTEAADNYDTNAKVEKIGDGFYRTNANADAGDSDDADDSSGVEEDLDYLDFGEGSDVNIYTTENDKEN